MLAIVSLMKIIENSGRKPVLSPKFYEISIIFPSSSTTSYRFSKKIMSQLQNWAILTYLRSKPRNTYIYLMQEHQNVSNTSGHQEVVLSLLNLPCYSHFSCFENSEHSFWKIMIFAAVTLFFWRSGMLKMIKFTVLCSVGNFQYFDPSTNIIAVHIPTWLDPPPPYKIYFRSHLWNRRVGDYCLVEKNSHRHLSFVPHTKKIQGQSSWSMSTGSLPFSVLSIVPMFKIFLFWINNFFFVTGGRNQPHPKYRTLSMKIKFNDVPLTLFLSPTT